MDAELVFSRLDELPPEKMFQQMVLWRVPTPVRASKHSYNYRFAFVVDGVCVLRYDNEAGKGDHKHVGESQLPYRFVDADTLITDFLADVARLRNEYGRR
ncbi:MAG: hypothetical protein HY834_18620 [Devosia nanyangense]|uniref:Uncharacterized protein n=1 Tax=Devosia nanyangense TaxID=1228055 RepID=A0A933L7E9_9HYPH|nr:hypothetical protein [Devosia nanyangense]